RERRESASRTSVGRVTRWISSVTSRVRFGAGEEGGRRPPPGGGGGGRARAAGAGCEGLGHEDAQRTRWERERAARRRPVLHDVPAATYSPTQSPRQYHRRGRA